MMGTKFGCRLYDFIKFENFLIKVKKVLKFSLYNIVIEEAFESFETNACKT